MHNIRKGGEIMSFGSSSGRSNSSQYSWGQSENISSAGSTNVSEDQSSSASQSQSGQDIWAPQAEVLPRMWDAAGEGALRSIEMQNNMMPQMSQTGNELMAGGPGGAIDAYGNKVSQIFNEQIMPGITGGAVQANGVGGSRMGVAQGVAARGARQQIQDFAGEQYQQDQDRRLQTMQSMPGMNQMVMQPYKDLSGIIGGPQVLGSSSSSANAKSTGSAYSVSDMLSQGYDVNEGSSESNSSNSGFNFGIPFL